MASRITRSVPVTVGDVLDGHVRLDLDCLDRVYPHGYLGRLQVGGQVVQFLNHRGYRVPSPACLQQIGDAFRRRVASFAEANHIPVVPLKAADRNIEVMRPYLARAAATGRSQVAAIGVAQEPQRVFIARKRDTDPSKPPQFSFDMKTDRRVTVYYFYLWDQGFGPAFIKVCTYWSQRVARLRARHVRPRGADASAHCAAARRSPASRRPLRLRAAEPPRIRAAEPLRESGQRKGAGEHSRSGGERGECSGRQCSGPHHRGCAGSRSWRGRRDRACAGQRVPGGAGNPGGREVRILRGRGRRRARSRSRPGDVHPRVRVPCLLSALYPWPGRPRTV